MKRITLIMLFCLMLLLIGCTISNANSKELSSLVIKCQTEKEYNIDDEIRVTIYFGTSVKNQKSDGVSSIDRYKADIFIINKKYIQSSEEEANFFWDYTSVEEAILVVNIDDFYEENYPLFIKRKICGCFSYSIIYEVPSNIEYVLPKSLFMDESGLIVIGIKSRETCDGCKLQYKIVENIIHISVA